ncbi:MAG: hypothetical protein M0R17_06970 [Candidatus Omnitrophica bacterium]|jgi:hypothetical protein|nr:hypothetical protein [Candidatus Omnitrophota bacterium]
MDKTKTRKAYDHHLKMVMLLSEDEKTEYLKKMAYKISGIMPSTRKEAMDIIMK